MYATDFRRRNMGQGTEKGRTAKRAKGKQAHPPREWTFVYGNGFWPIANCRQITVDLDSKTSAIDTIL